MGVQLVHMVNQWQPSGVGAYSPNMSDEQDSKSVSDDSLTNSHSRTTTTTIITTFNALTRVSCRNYPRDSRRGHYTGTTTCTPGITHYQSPLPLVTTHTHTSSNSDRQSRDRIGTQKLQQAWCWLSVNGISRTPPTLELGPYYLLLG